MRFLSTFGVIAIAVAASGSIGCIFEESSSSSGHYVAPAPTSSPTPTQPPATPPMLSLDTGRTLTATPGDGAGVFVTYRTGGQWSLQWTCDTNLSSESCAFDLSISASSITSTQAVPQTALVSYDLQNLHLQTDTASTLDSVTFSTPPGAPIVLGATINGRAMPSLVFYVSNHTLQTAPTNPVEFVPTDP